jgi:chaperonin cofactor prefoldin
LDFIEKFYSQEIKIPFNQSNDCRKLTLELIVEILEHTIVIATQCRNKHKYIAIIENELCEADAEQILNILIDKEVIKEDDHDNVTTNNNEEGEDETLNSWKVFEKIDMLENKINRLTNENENLLNRVHDLNITVCQYEAIIEETEHKFKLLEHNDPGFKHCDNIAILTELYELKNKYSDLQKISAEEKKLHEELVENLNNQIQMLENRIAVMKPRYEKYDSVIEKLDLSTFDLKSLKCKLNNYDTQLSEQKQMCKIMEGENCRILFERHNSRKVTFEKSCTDLRRDFSALETKHDSFIDFDESIVNDEYKDLLNQMKNLKSENESLILENNDLRNQLQKISDDMKSSCECSKEDICLMSYID